MHGSINIYIMMHGFMNIYIMMHGFMNIYIMMHGSMNIKDICDVDKYHNAVHVRASTDSSYDKTNKCTSLMYLVGYQTINVTFS